jgi:hypothetical protein
MVGVLWAWAAWAGQPVVAPECMFLPPDVEFRQYVGRATGPDATSALAAAQADARRQAADAVCAGRPDVDACATAYRGVGFERDTDVQPARRGFSACFTVEIAALLTDPALRREKIERSIEALALTIARSGRTGPVSVSPVRWEGDGCDTGYAGAALRDDVVAALTARGVAVSVSGDGHPRGTWRTRRRRRGGAGGPRRAARTAWRASRRSVATRPTGGVCTT